MDRRSFRAYCGPRAISTAVPSDTLASQLTDAEEVDGLSLLSTCSAPCLQEIFSVLNGDGLVDFEFADLEYLLADATHVEYWSGCGSGEMRVQKALHAAFQSTLLPRHGEIKLLVALTTNQLTLELQDIRDVQAGIEAHMGMDTYILLGTINNDHMSRDEMRISFLAAYSQVG